MNISELQKISDERVKRWHEEGDWSLLEWAGAMCGEAGECANIAKKMRRLEQALPNKEAGLNKSNYNELRVKCAMEVADTILYGLCLLSRLDTDASIILEFVFNQKSIEYGFPERAPKGDKNA